MLGKIKLFITATLCCSLCYANTSKKDIEQCVLEVKKNALSLYEQKKRMLFPTLGGALAGGALTKAALKARATRETVRNVQKSVQYDARIEMLSAEIDQMGKLIKQEDGLSRSGIRASLYHIVTKAKLSEKRTDLSGNQDKLPRYASVLEHRFGQVSLEYYDALHHRSQGLIGDAEFKKVEDNFLKEFKNKKAVARIALYAERKKGKYRGAGKAGMGALAGAAGGAGVSIITAKKCGGSKGGASNIETYFVASLAGNCLLQPNGLEDLILSDHQTLSNLCKDYPKLPKSLKDLYRRYNQAHKSLKIPNVKELKCLGPHKARLTFAGNSPLGDRPQILTFEIKENSDIIVKGKFNHHSPFTAIYKNRSWSNFTFRSNPLSNLSLGSSSRERNDPTSPNFNPPSQTFKRHFRNSKGRKDRLGDLARMGQTLYAAEAKIPVALGACLGSRTPTSPPRTQPIPTHK